MEVLMKLPWYAVIALLFISIVVFTMSRYYFINKFSRYVKHEIDEKALSFHYDIFKSSMGSLAGPKQLDEYLIMIRKMENKLGVTHKDFSDEIDKYIIELTEAYNKDYI